MLPSFKNFPAIQTVCSRIADFVKKMLTKFAINEIRVEIMSEIKLHHTEYRLWLFQYLRAKQCEWKDCEINDPDMLVMNHLNPKEKRLEVSKMVQCSYSLKTIQAEVAKCRVLCANHHQKYTIQQFGYKKWLPPEFL